MTGKTHHTHFAEPASFSFSVENTQKAASIIAKYPAGRQQSAVMPLLMLAQKQSGGWLPKVAMDAVASMLGMPPVRVYEVATFYTMYNLEPIGQHLVEVCTTTPCWLRGSDAIVNACEGHLGISMGETTPDGMFTLKEAECLGACVNAPMCQIDEQYFEDLTPDAITEILDILAAGRKPKPGPQNGRHSSEPAGGLTTLSKAGAKHA